MLKSVAAKQLLRIIDANFNRAKEGLRVCEDVSRYGFNRQALTRQFKDIRHQLTDAVSSLKIINLVSARDIHGDVGKQSTVSELKRKTLSDVFWANAQRVKESLRVLEEVTKLLDTQCSSNIKELRYKLYALEQKMVTGR